MAHEAPRPAVQSGGINPPVHRTISSDELMGGERVVVIRHGKEEYRLRITASDKLILTK